jgi:hypothetical protein
MLCSVLINCYHNYFALLGSDSCMYAPIYLIHLSIIFNWHYLQKQQTKQWPQLSSTFKVGVGISGGQYNNLAKLSRGPELSQICMV